MGFHRPGSARPDPHRRSQSNSAAYPKFPGTSCACPAVAVIASWKFRRLMLCVSTEPMRIWKDVGMKLLDNGCQERTGRLEEDGCWPSFETT